MTGAEHYANAESDLEHAARASDKGCRDDMAYWLGCAQVHATLAAAPQPWLRCVDQIGGTGIYPLNPAHVVYFRRGKDGQWWEAVDVHRGYHVIASDDDARVEALIGGQP